MAHDIHAERAMLGATIQRPDAARQHFLALPVKAWWDLQHDLVASVIREQYNRGEPVDPQIIARKAAQRTGTDDQARRVSMLVLELHGLTLSGTLDWYADKVRSLAAVRLAAEAAQRFVQRHDALVDDDDALSSQIAMLRTACDDADLARRPTGVGEPPMSLDELLSTPVQFDWLVPGLLERTDRMILTGFEGTGKSYALAQLALTVAAGLHPFTGDLIPANDEGFRVLVVDCENSQRQLARRYRRIRDQVDRLRMDHGMDSVDWKQAVRFVIRPEGVSITEPRELGRIEQAIATTSPDLLVIGPLYRLHKIDIRDEQAAKELTDTLDVLRVRHQFALIAEAHVGHVGEASGGRKLRPTGSSLFLRWPEFGYGIRAYGDAVHQEHPSVVELIAWRGSRDERAWPTLLRHGTSLPWEPADSSYRGHYNAA